MAAPRYRPTVHGSRTRASTIAIRATRSPACTSWIGTAAGYVVFYTNPRGSTSYGEEFGNLIHHAYPGRDYDDLMSGVDAVWFERYRVRSPVSD